MWLKAGCLPVWPVIIWSLVTTSLKLPALLGKISQWQKTKLLLATLGVVKALQRQRLLPLQNFPSNAGSFRLVCIYYI